MGNKSEPEDGASALPHPKMGKREGDDEDKKQVIAKKRKKDEVAEEQKNKEEINSDYSEHDKKPEAGKSEPANSCGSLESSDDGGSEPDSDRSSDEDNGAMDICKGDSSKQCDEEAQKIKMEVLMNAASDAEKPDLKTVKMDTSNDTDSSDDDDDDDDHDDDHDDDSSDGTEKRDMVKKPVKDLESPEYNEYEIEDKISKTPQERNETPVTLNEKYAASKTIYVRNLSYSVERADMENLFKDCGEVVDVRFNIDREGRFRGFGHVEFGTTEAAQNALELDNTELLKRRIKVGIALERGGYAPNRSLFHKCGRFQSDTLSVKDFDTSHVENKPKTPATPNVKNAASKTIFVRNLSYIVERADMENLFKDCGEIVDIRLHTDREGRFKGFGHVEFATAEAAQKAVELDNTEVLKRRIIVGIAQERGEYTPNRSSWSSSFHKDERFQSQNVPAKCLDTPLVEHKLTCAKEVKDMEMFDASSAENKVVIDQCPILLQCKISNQSYNVIPAILQPETPATRKEKNAASKTICLRNLSYGVERADIENLFKDCGEIVDVRLHMDVEFATAEAAEKALELDYMELLNRPIKVGIAPEKGEYFPNSSSLSNSFQKDESFQSLTVFVIGFDTSLAEEKIKASLKEHFSSCGEITRISIPKFPDYGAVKGFAHLDFKDFDGFKKALQLNQTELQGYRLSVEKAKPKPRRDNQGIGGCIGGGGGSYHFGGRDGGDHGGRVSWGDNQGIGGGRGGGGSYHYGRRDGGDHGGRVGWGDNQGKGGGGGSYHYGGRDGGDHGGRVGWGRSHGAGRHWTANIPSTDEGTGTKNTFDYRRY